MDNKVIIIGYSEHGLVACDLFLSRDWEIVGYCDVEEKTNNPYQLDYLGQETNSDVLSKLAQTNWFVGIGDNKLRKKVYSKVLQSLNKPPANAIDKSAFISRTATIGNGIFVGGGVMINACAKIGDGVICNTKSVIEHQCEIGDFTHIAPGAILCGRVKVGANSFIGAGSVIKQGVAIGDNVIIGAGTVVIKDIPSDKKVVGNPQRFI